MIDHLAHTRVVNCYQCGKCTAGCPVAEVMDVVPNQLVRLAQIGDTDPATASVAIWRCVACQTCSERCPKEVDVAGVLDAFRQLSVERGVVANDAHRTVIFQKVFLRNIRRNGRLNELALIGRFKAEGFVDHPSVPWLMREAALAPATARRRKLHFRPDRVQDRAVVRRIFDRCMGED
jgi:heterodisulfide reductase subunit C